MEISYKKRKKYKYTLFRDVSLKIENLEVKVPGDWGVIAITEDGLLTLKQGYTWDGPSGPAIDSRVTFMRSSLVHDALYQLMREQKIEPSQRKRADQVLRELCLQHGMTKIRAWWVYRAVRAGAANSAKPDLITAP